MAETLGSLCDKLTIVKLKQYHTVDSEKLINLNSQEIQLVDEIDCFIKDAFEGKINVDKLKFAANKIYKSEGNEFREIAGSIGLVISELSKVNCELWHEQEKIYDFEVVPEKEKNSVIKKLAILNLERNKCIDVINEKLVKIISN